MMKISTFFLNYCKNALLVRHCIWAPADGPWDFFMFTNHFVMKWLRMQKNTVKATKPMMKCHDGYESSVS